MEPEGFVEEAQEKAFDTHVAMPLLGDTWLRNKTHNYESRLPPSTGESKGDLLPTCFPKWESLQTGHWERMGGAQKEDGNTNELSS